MGKHAIPENPMEITSADHIIALPRTEAELAIGTVITDMEHNHQLDYPLEARKVAIQNIETSNMKNKIRFDERRLEHDFQVNDYVMYEWPKADDHKLSPKYKGPYQITKKVGSVCYEIKNLQKLKQKKIVHVQYLKPLISSPNLDCLSDEEHNNYNHDDDDDNQIVNTPEIPNKIYEDDDNGKVPYTTSRGCHTRRKIQHV
ncbi:unnamed protein product [Danaus chrysippus]|uniref:(African queen) hypothetical protein n=1 Tax=Danaus chrysippus TaxID=151541 RepID=A0A8J2R2M8_9NEOP|nr:unnamed protein product [Danaus chrysippus]